MSITTIISISVNAAGFRLLNKFIFSFALVNAGQWLASAFAVLLRRATARQEANPNIFASEAVQLRGIMSKIVKGVVETRSSKLGAKRGSHNADPIAITSTSTSMSMSRRMSGVNCDW